MKLKEIMNQISEGTISEANLSRLLSKVQNKDFCIATAFRGEYTLKQNKQRNSQLLTFLNSKQMGGYMLIGHWQEAPDDMDWKDATPEELTDSVEESVLFVRPESMSQDEFIEFCTGIGKKYNQDAVVVGLFGKGIFLYFKNGGNDKIGDKVVLNKIGQAYSQMRKKKNVPFIFEGVYHPTNNIGKMAFEKKGIKYVK